MCSPRHDAVFCCLGFRLVLSDAEAQRTHSPRRSATRKLTQARSGRELEHDWVRMLREAAAPPPQARGLGDQESSAAAHVPWADKSRHVPAWLPEKYGRSVSTPDENGSFVAGEDGTLGWGGEPQDAGASFRVLRRLLGEGFSSSSKGVRRAFVRSVVRVYPGPWKPGVLRGEGLLAFSLGMLGLGWIRDARSSPSIRAD
jgi:hypothetical protein